MNPKAGWWGKLRIIPEPYPHIPEREILAAMPEELKPLWQEFMFCKGMLVMDDGGHAIYPEDFFEFLRIRAGVVSGAKKI